MNNLKGSIFERLKNYLNSRPDGCSVSRSELINYVENSSTVDNYRRRLQICGYLDHYYDDTGKIQGRYVKIKDIPEKYTTTDLHKEWEMCKMDIKWRYQNNRKYLKDVKI